MRQDAFLKIEHVSVRYDQTVILSDIDLSLHEGDWLMIAGPNGAGKTTILRTISGAVPYEGSITWQGRNIRSYTPAQLARDVGFLAQESPLSFPFTVSEIVRLGRYAYRESAAETEEHVQEALAMTGLQELKDRSVLSLSGGEQQRVFLAQLFAQDPRVLILDEPTSHLDLVYQKQIFSLIREWLRSPGRAVISVVHDLSLVKAYGSSACLLRGGKVVAFGPTAEVLTPERLTAVYDMDVYAWMQDMLGQWQPPAG